jgi:hypothetical protein
MSLRNCFHYDESTRICRCRKPEKPTWTTWVMVTVYHTRADWLKHADEWRTGQGRSPSALLEATLAHIKLNRDECPQGSLTLPKTCINWVKTECTYRSSV